MVELTITTAPGSAYVFNNDQILDMSDLRWRGKLGGGLGNISDYDAKLYVPLDTQKAIKDALARSEVQLRVTVNSDTFNPHLGRIAGYERDAEHLDLLTLTIADRRFFDVPKLPYHSILASWSNPNPVEINADAGFPLYYGDESLRDIYFTCITSDFSVFLGPSNVSSPARINAAYHRSDLIWRLKSAGSKKHCIE